MTCHSLIHYQVRENQLSDLVLPPPLLQLLVPSFPEAIIKALTLLFGCEVNTHQIETDWNGMMLGLSFFFFQDRRRSVLLFLQINIVERKETCAAS